MDANVEATREAVDLAPIRDYAHPVRVALAIPPNLHRVSGWDAATLGRQVQSVKRTCLLQDVIAIVLDSVRRDDLLRLLERERPRADLDAGFSARLMLKMPAEGRKAGVSGLRVG